MEQFKAFTVSFNGITDALRTTCGVCQAISLAELKNGAKHPEIKEFNAIWDTGATRTSISKKVVDALGLQTLGYGTNHTAGGNITVTMHSINLMLPMGLGIPSLFVSCSDLDGPDILIGMDVIARGDFSVTNVGGKTTFSFRIPSIKTIDYVKDSQELARYIKIHSEWLKHGNKLCPCGSGKVWEKCHGKD